MAEFAETVSTMRGGAADRAASAALKKLVEAVRATGKGGTVSLKIAIAPLKDGDGELEVEAKIDLTLPAEDLDLYTLWGLRSWVSEALESRGAKVTGAGVGVSGPFGMTDIDVEIGDYRFNLEVRPRAVPSWVPPPVELNSKKPFESTDADWEKAAAFCAKWMRDHGYDPESAS